MAGGAPTAALAMAGAARGEGCIGLDWGVSHALMQTRDHTHDLGQHDGTWHVIRRRSLICIGDACCWTSFDPTRITTYPRSRPRSTACAPRGSWLSVCLACDAYFVGDAVSRVDWNVEGMRPARHARSERRDERRNFKQVVGDSSARQAKRRRMERPVVWFAAGVDRAHNSCRPTATLNQPQTLLPLDFSVPPARKSLGALGRCWTTTAEGVCEEGRGKDASALAR